MPGLDASQRRGGHLGPGRGLAPARLHELAPLLGPHALLLHRAFEALAVHGDPALGSDLLGQLDREAVGVVEREGILAGERLRPALEQRLEPREPGLEGPDEPALLLVQHVQHALAVLGQLAIVAAEDGDGALGHRRQERVVDAEPLTRPPARHRAAQQSPQHVARALVAGQRPLGDREGERADMVRDDAGVAHGGHARRPALRLAQHLVHQRSEDVGLEDGALPLQDEREALEPHAGVDAWARQRLQRPIRLGIELREDQVPELHEAVAGIAGRLAPERARRQVVGPLRAEIEIHLAARTARPAPARRAPEVVLAPERHDAALRQPDLLPQRHGLVVARQPALSGEDRGVDPLPRQVEHLRHELPGEGDRLLLEVGAPLARTEGEVAQHLEEGVVPRRVPDVLQVGQAQALLHRRGARVGHVARGRVVGLELHHARGGEEQRRVAHRHQRRGGHHAVPALLEELQEGTA